MNVSVQLHKNSYLWLKPNKIRTIMDTLKRNKSFEVLKGIVALILAVLIFVNPAGALVTIATYIGILAIVSGIILIVLALSNKGNFWQFLLFQGIVLTLIGTLIVTYPGSTAKLMIFFVGLLITLIGIMQLIAYLQMKEFVTAPHLSLVNSVLSILVGALFLFNPFEGAVFATIILGIYAVWFGISRLYVAWLLFRHG